MLSIMLSPPCRVSQNGELASVDAVGGIHPVASEADPTTQLVHRDGCAMAFHHRFPIEIVTAVARPAVDAQNVTAHLPKNNVLRRGIFSYFFDCAHLWMDAR
jgi:hypothetical protein